MKKLLTALIIICSFFALGARMAKAESLSNKFSGMILLQVESRGEAWYINPTDQSRCYLGKQDDAFKVMRELGLGIKHETLTKYLNSKFPSALSGKILLDVEKNGEAYYVYPKNNKGYFLGKPSDAYRIMREKGLGISNKNLDTIKINKKYTNIATTQTSTKVEESDNQYTIDLVNNSKWSISIKELLSKNTGFNFKIARNNEELLNTTSKTNSNTGILEESPHKYTATYNNRLDLETFKYTEYVRLLETWYDYPAIRTGFNYTAYYIPVVIKDKKFEGIMEYWHEIKNLRGDGVSQFEITELDKSPIDINCIVRGFTNSTGKFYYTKDSKRFKLEEFFKCFNNEDEAKKDGYTKSFDN